VPASIGGGAAVDSSAMEGQGRAARVVGEGDTVPEGLVNDELARFRAPLADEELEALRALVDEELDAYLDDLATLVNLDSGSYTKAGVDRVARWTGRFLERLGASVEYLAHERLGETVVARFRGRTGGPSALLVGHMDTVFDEGTARARPFRRSGGRAYGPGVADMKSGLLAGLYALLALRALAQQRDDPDDAWLPYQELVFIANPDEEIGSPASTPAIREAAMRSDLALVLECARANGDIVSSRKGTVEFRLALSGRAAHAGVEPEKGRSAVLEAAHKTIALHALTGRWEGVTCNVGVVRGGTRPNVVPAQATLEVDLRSPARSSLEAAENEVRRIAGTSVVPDVESEVTEVARHWPMEKLPASGRLVDHAQEIARRLGFRLADAATGGASDANTTAGLGVPTLDGLGPVGGNDHSPDEYLELDSIVPRVTLLAALLLALGRDEGLQTRTTP
jgi:glutamate carboxypeptidase